MVIEIYILLFFAGLIIIILFKVFDFNNKINMKNGIDIINKKKICFKDNKFLKELINNNEPQFIILFMKHYPLFLTKMQKLNPHISNNELTFLAFCYLNLSTKKISEITFVSQGAVAMRKNRIRKKYNVDSTIPFNKWIKDYIDN